MEAHASPDLLHKPKTLKGVVRLNNKPLMIAFALLGLVALALAWSIQQRGQAARDETDEETDTTVLSAVQAARRLIEGHGEGFIAAAEAPPPGLAPPTRVVREPAVDHALEAPPAALTTSRIDEEVARQWRRRLWRQHEQLDAALGAETRVAVEGAEAQPTSTGTPPAPSSLLDPYAALQGRLDTLSAPHPGPQDPNLQGRKEAFLEQAYEAGTLPFTRQAARPNELKTGTVIPAVMVGGINSDLPGQILAQVSQHVWDTARGEQLLIPQGTKLVGAYDSHVAHGQRRVLVAWHLLVFPDGSSLNLSNMPGTDQAGYAGFKDKVNTHWWRIFRNALLLSVLSAGFQLSQPDSSGDNPTPQQQVAASLGQELSQVSGNLIRRGLDVQPTLEIRPGYRFNVMVNQDIRLEPYVLQRRSAAVASRLPVPPAPDDSRLQRLRQWLATQE